MLVQTWAGSIACATFGFVVAASYVQIAAWLGLLQPWYAFHTIVANTAISSVISAAAESLPVGEWDNLVISLAAAGSSYILYR